MATVDIVSTYGAPTDGVTSSSTAFASFRTAQQGASGLTLTLGPPNTTYLLNTTELDGSPFKIPKGITQLVVVGSNNSIVAPPGTTSAVFSCGVEGQHIDNTHSTRVATVAAGSISFTVTDPSILTISTWNLLTGGDLQGGTGVPSNPWVFEYVFITNIVGSVVTVSAPLQYGYKSTWPLYNPGSNLFLDQGGPATIYALFSNWDVDVEYQNITFNQYQSQYGAAGRRVVFTNCTVLMDPTGAGVGRGINPSTNKYFEMNGCTSTQGEMEVDKLITEMVLKNSTFGNVQFQSAGSVNLCTFDNSVAALIDGTSKRFVSTNGGIITQLTLGAAGYGNTTDVVLDPNTAIGSIVAGGIIETGAGDGSDPGLIAAGWTMANGVITIPNSYVPRWAVPGAQCMWTGQYRNQKAFHVLDVTQSGTNTIVQTTWVGGFPSFAAGELASGTKLYLSAHPAPRISGIGYVDGQPLYAKATETVISPTAGSQLRVWGRIKTLSINVTVPYAGAGSLALNLSEFNNWPVLMANNSAQNFGSAVAAGPVVNAKIAGERLYTSTNGGVPVITGLQSGDTLPDLGEAFWFQDGSNSAPVWSNAVSGATVVITITTDQGISSTSVPPVRLRVHS